ncbi:MAG TPA: biopolymer transporter ExbD [Rhodothermales bacterium]|nr:biopolymer transporter ExbD [Rhodothermales bacterium]
MATFDFSQQEKPLSTFSLAGLADIILLLLIFFILTSSFVTQFGIQVTLPKTDAGVTADEQYVTVTLTEDGNYFVEQSPATREELLVAIRTAVGDKSALLMRADEKASIGQFAVVANIAKALNLRVLMATERERFR